MTTTIETTAVDRDQLVQELNDYLEIGAVSDYGPNGLQVEGRRQIRRLATGVSACQELFDRAAAAGADAVLVHHGLFWNWSPRALTGMTYRRVARLLEAGINLLAYHLPLDRHPQVGNNALAARALGLTDLEPFGVHEGQTVGFRGRFPSPIAADELWQRVEAFYHRQPLVFDHGPDPVSTLGIVSGGAKNELYQAIEAGLDAYLTGEVSEWVMNVAREEEIHYVSAGHYATECCGVQALGERIAAQHGIEVEFVDVPNPV